MSDLVIWARIVQQGASRFLIVVSSAAAHPGDESSATDVRTAEMPGLIEAEKCRDVIVTKMTEDNDRRGHRIVRVEHI